ncbi:dihydrolipoamide acetyltransferase family protein [Lutispora sp.]|uniref:dihydrolipoamide acetyltransferase family protein n=1 Tax=Lutispora sp. TaxID=2828727 RepID=UPI0035636C0D
MAKRIIMPKLGLTMKDGRIARWYKKENDFVKAGDILFSIETDKLTNDVESKDDGVLRKIIANVGDVVPCLDTVAILADPDEDISDLLAEISPAKKELNQTSADETAGPKEMTGKKGERINISPVAKKLAVEHGIDPSEIKGTGPNGRIVLEDVQKHIERKEKIKATPAAIKAAEKLDIDISMIEKEDRIRKEDVYKYYRDRKLDYMAEPKDERVPMSTMRKIISERMSHSWSTAPVVNYDIRVDTTRMKELKEQLKPKANITYTDMLVAIVSRVLLDFPLLNGTIDGEEMILRNYVNMGAAVALEDGLIVPVIKHSHIKGLKEISDEIKDLSYRAKNNQLLAEEISGGTFTITNIGMYGIESFTPIINQPESAILGVNAIVDTPVAINGNIVIKPLMNLSLTADHRLVDGAVAAKFMAKFKEYIENPALLLL